MLNKTTFVGIGEDKNEQQKYYSSRLKNKGGYTIEEHAQMLNQRSY